MRASLPIFSAASKPDKLSAVFIEAVPRFQSLHAWRGVCAILVAALHFHTTGFIHESALIKHSYRFVDFFFVLSGFVIAIVYRTRLERREARGYLWKRVGRLWPLHLVTLTALVFMAVAGSRVGLELDEFRWSALPANILLVHSWGLFDQLTWNTPSWSISTEIFAYAVFALAAGYASTRWLNLTLVGIAVAALVIICVAPEGMASTYDFGLARCVYGFFVGALTAAWWTSCRWRPRGELAAVAIMVAAVCWLPFGAGPLVVPVFAWVVIVFASAGGPISKLLDTRIPQRLGTWSYSIYMVHTLVNLAMLAGLSKLTPLTGRVDGVFSIVGPWWVSDGLTIAYLCCVVAVAALSYRLVELPGQVYFARLAGRVRAPARSVG